MANSSKLILSPPFLLVKQGETMTLPSDIRQNGKIAELRKARKCHNCSGCRQPITEGTRYYSVTYAGAGLSSIKFPDRFHAECVGDFMKEGSGEPTT